MDQVISFSGLGFLLPSGFNSGAVAGWSAPPCSLIRMSVAGLLQTPLIETARKLLLAGGP
jgi:hypothetical protein